MSNQANINSFLDSMDEAPADQFTAAENSFASPVGNPQQAPYTPGLYNKCWGNQVEPTKKKLK